MIKFVCLSENTLVEFPIDLLLRFWWSLVLSKTLSALPISRIEPDLISLLGLRLRADPRSRGNGVFERDVPSISHLTAPVRMALALLRQSESPWKLFLGEDSECPIVPLMQCVDAAGVG